MIGFVAGTVAVRAITGSVSVAGKFWATARVKRKPVATINAVIFDFMGMCRFFIHFCFGHAIRTDAMEVIGLLEFQ